MKPLHAKPEAGSAAAPKPADERQRGEVRHLTVGEQGNGQRLDNFLQGRLKEVPKSLVYRIIRTGQVRVNGHRSSAEHKISLGDDVRIPPISLNGGPDPGRGPAGAAGTLGTAGVTGTRRSHPPLQVPILLEDDSLIALDKPAGLAVHGGSGIRAGLIEQLRASRPEAPFLELVHRLDRDTSGILLVAKKRNALLTLHRALAEGSVHKRYVALVKGYWGRSAASTLRFPLHRYVAADGERRVRVQPDGQAASTRVHLVRHIGCAGLAGFPPFLSLLECELLTGRTHQIRVHLAEAGFPILGDQKYGDFDFNKLLHKQGHRRMFLHALALETAHPATGTLLKLQSPLPDAFAAIEGTIRTASAQVDLK